MTTLATQLFPKAEENMSEEEQLLKLFWNRAEVKKELDKLRDQSFDLEERLKQQEALTLRVQHRLEQLEARLGNPEHSMTVVVYYQLRTIWDHCHSRLQSRCFEIERAQYDKEKRVET
jgi:predicted nuclease with TOPRIM domain